MLILYDSLNLRSFYKIKKQSVQIILFVKQISTFSQLHEIPF